MRDLNTFYRGEPSLYELDFDPAGSSGWTATIRSAAWSAFSARAKDADDMTLFVCNFTPVPRHNYRVGVPAGGFWREDLNSDAPLYGGSGQGNMGGVRDRSFADPRPAVVLNLTLPPLGIVVFKPESRNG